LSLDFDINSEKWLSIWKLDNMNNPLYYETMIKYFKNICFSLGREDLVLKIDIFIKDTIEDFMGASLTAILFTYRNLPALNSFTRSRNPSVNREIYKYELKMLLDDVEKKVFFWLIELEGSIRFQDRQRII